MGADITVTVGSPVASFPFLLPFLSSSLGDTRARARARAHSPTLLHRLQDDDADSSNCTYSPVLRLSLGDSEERLLISTFTRQNV